MGPPRERGGELDSPAAAELTGLRLQWGRRANAAESVPRNCGPVNNSYQLQWGRRANAAESVVADGGRLTLATASMGPPRERGGEDHKRQHGQS